MAIPIIIDCDPGVDDALAIILALNDSRIDLKAICTVTGNGNLESTTTNGLNILALCDRKDIPLYKGSATALDGIEPETVPAFGDDGLGGYAHTIVSDKKPEEENAVDFLIKAVNKAPHELTLLVIGPCTNIAKAIRKSPGIVKKVKEVIIMGGSKYTGNMSPVAEYNFWADPLAAKEVLVAGFENVTMIGLDVTNKIAMDSDIREILKILNTKLSTFIYEITQEGVNDNWAVRKKPVAPMHDILTIAYLIDRSILTVKPAYIDVVVDGIAKGQSIVDINGHWKNGECNAAFAEKVDYNKFYKLFLTTVFKEYEKEFNEYLTKNLKEEKRK